MENVLTRHHQDGIDEVVNNPKITSAIQLGSELVRKLFSDDELATSTVTGRKVIGRTMKRLDPVRLQYIDNLMKQ